MLALINFLKQGILLSVFGGLAFSMSVHSAFHGDATPVGAEDLGPAATALDVNHHHLLRSVAQYVERSGMASKDSLQMQLDRYIQILKALEHHREIASEYRAQLTKGHDASNTHGTADEILARVIGSLDRLLHNGEPTLVYTRLLIDWIVPGDTQGLFEIRSTLYALGDDINAVELAAVAYSDLLNQEKAVQKLKLKRQLHTAHLLIAMVIIGSLLLTIKYLINKNRSAAGLKAANDKLLLEIKASDELTRELEHLATHDVLSGVLNRRGFMQQLEEVLGKTEGQSGLCFIDLDLFKIVNDTAGHAAGDQLIREVAQTLSGAVAEHGASVARFGGDEFLILLPECTEVEFRDCIARAHGSLSPYNFSFEERYFSITGSFGAVYFWSAAHDSHSLLTAVDTACYDAKNAGGGRIQYSNDDEKLIESRRHDVDWVNRINEALRNDWFCLYYQPIVKTIAADQNEDQAQQVHSWEMLVRMMQSDGNIISPAIFLDVAERYSLATRIDKWVVNHAFEWLSANRQVLKEIDLININLSGKTIGDWQFLAYLESKVAACDVPAHAICFEITETAAIGDHALEFLLRLKEIGFKIALDDFGSGFSSFGYLEKLPVDYIKLDGRFVRDIDSNDVHREFVKAIHTVGKAMNKPTVAEFLENAQSLLVLQQIGVEYVQGYYIARPQLLPDCRLELGHRAA